MRKHCMRFTVVLVTMMAAAGCSSGTPVVWGVVTLDGEPLDNGTLEFFPNAGDGQTAAAVIGKDGSYHAEVSPTKMKVVIRSSKVVGQRKMYENVADSPMVD